MSASTEVPHRAPPRHHLRLRFFDVMEESGRQLRSISVFDVAEGMRALGSRWMNDSVCDFSRIPPSWSESTTRMELAVRTKTGAFALGAVRVSGVSWGRALPIDAAVHGLLLRRFDRAPPPPTTRPPHASTRARASSRPRWRSCS